MPTNRILTLAANAASQSTSRWRVGAVAYKGSRIYGIGVNDMLKTSPRSWHTFKTRHAEFNALSHVAREDLKGLSLYVHRIGRDGKVHLSKPCEHCQRMLAWAEIRRVEWSVD